MLEHVVIGGGNPGGLVRYVRLRKLGLYDPGDDMPDAGEVRPSRGKATERLGPRAGARPAAEGGTLSRSSLPMPDIPSLMLGGETARR